MTSRIVGRKESVECGMEETKEVRVSMPFANKLRMEAMSVCAPCQKEKSQNNTEKNMIP